MRRRLPGPCGFGLAAMLRSLPTAQCEVYQAPSAEADTRIQSARGWRGKVKWRQQKYDVPRSTGAVNATTHFFQRSSYRFPIQIRASACASSWWFCCVRMTALAGKLRRLTGPLRGPTGALRGPTGRNRGPTERLLGPTGRMRRLTGPLRGPTGPLRGPTGPLRGPTGPLRGPTHCLG